VRLLALLVQAGSMRDFGDGGAQLCDGASAAVGRRPQCSMGRILVLNASATDMGILSLARRALTRRWAASPASGQHREQGSGIAA